MNYRVAVKEIGAMELKKRLDSGEAVAILDVREPHELAICKLANTFHIPVGALMDRMTELEPYKDRELIVYCRSGGRSARAAAFLGQQGFKSVYNLHGGILAWSDEVDPTVTKY